MKRLKNIIVIGILFLFVSSIYAQDTEIDEQAETIATMEAALATMEAVATQSAESFALAHEASLSVQSNAELAFNLLGLFEAFSVVLAVVAAGLSFVGFTRVFRAQDELTSAREEVAKQLESLKNQFDEEVSKQRREAAELQHQLEYSAEERRIVTEKALLAQAYIPLGERQYKAQDYSGAISTYQQAIALDPNNPVIHYRLGYVFTQQGDFDSARQHYETAMSLADNFAPAMAGLGFVIRRQGEQMDDGMEKKEAMNQAEKLLLKAMELSPKLVDDDGESWWGILGGLYRRRGQIDDAIDAYKQATFVTPQSSYGFGNLALLYMQKNLREEMLDTYAEVEKLAAAESAADVNNYWGHADLVVSRYALGKTAEAKPVLERAMQIAPLESPFMLEGLQGTLEDLTKVLKPEKIASIKEAINQIKEERVRREKVLAERREIEALQTGTVPIVQPDAT